MNFDKFPLTKKFLEQHPNWTFQQCFDFIEKEYEKLKEGEGNGTKIQ